jgi:hypothetical protein
MGLGHSGCVKCGEPIYIHSGQYGSLCHAHFVAEFSAFSYPSQVPDDVRQVWQPMLPSQPEEPQR